MNPQFDKQNNLNLPPPMPEAGPMPMQQAPEQQPPMPEAPATSPEKRHQTTATPPVFSPPVLKGKQQVKTATNDVPATTTTSTPVMADDSDLIEKEWVTKAKEIIENTKEDPYRQSKEMTAFRADYMQKRYNKTIKVSE